MGEVRENGMTAEASEERALGKIKIEFEPEDQIELQLLLVGESPTTLGKGCIIVAQFAEADGTIIEPPYEGWHTGEDGRPFIYALVERAGSLDAEDGSIETASLQHRRPQTPPQARSAIFFLERWRGPSRLVEKPITMTINLFMKRPCFIKRLCAARLALRS